MISQNNLIKSVYLQNKAKSSYKLRDFDIFII